MGPKIGGLHIGPRPSTSGVPVSSRRTGVCSVVSQPDDDVAGTDGDQNLGFTMVNTKMAGM